MYIVKYVLYNIDIFIIYKFVEDIKPKTVQNRVVTPHTSKKPKVYQNNGVRSQNKPETSISTQTGNKTNKKNTIKAQSEMKKTVTKTLVDMQDGKSSIRRSSRLANKPSISYKC